MCNQKIKVYRININSKRCTGCNDCVVSCPINFDQLREKSYLTEENAVLLVKNGCAVEIYNENRKINCDGCGVCIENCPLKALSMKIIEII